MPAIASLAEHAVIRQAWEGPQTFASTLLVLFVDTYGTEGFAWDPATILLELEEDFRVDLPQANFDRLMAAIQLLTTDDFYKSLPDFIQICNVLNGDTASTQWDPADADEIAWGVTEALLLSPPEEEEPFTEEIRAYMGAVLDMEGIMQPPDILRLALRGTDPAALVQNDFSDDPEMFSAIYGFERGKTDAINQLVRTALQNLSQQLASLPLRNGIARDVVQQLTDSLTKQATAPEPVPFRSVLD